MTFIPSILLIFTLCSAICQEGCPSHVASLQSVNYGYRSFSHSQNRHFLLCQFVGAANNSLLWWLIIWCTELCVCVCVCIPLQMASHRYSDNICEWRSWKKGEREGASPPSAALLRRWHTCTSKLKCSLLVWQSEAGGTVQMLLLAVNYTFGDRYVFNLGKRWFIKANKAPHIRPPLPLRCRSEPELLD